MAGRRGCRCCRWVAEIWTRCVSCCAARSFPSRPELALLREIAAAPRPTGGEAIAAARDRCARELEGLGFHVDTQRFEYSAAPGRFGLPVIGAMLAVLVQAAAALNTVGSYVPITILAIGAIAVGLTSRWMLRRAVLDAPFFRRRGVNLVARRGERPPVWLAAHLDTKSQPFPTLVRSGALVLECVGFGLALIAAIMCVLRLPGDEAVWVVAVVATIAGAIPTVASVVGDRSAGALDNASGVVTTIEAARLLGRDTPAGIVLTDAEELGLAGARAWANTISPGAALIVLNCDGVDDEGEAVVMHAGGRGAPLDLLIAIRRASDACGVPIRVRHMLPGVLTDSVAFAGAGAQTATFSRGSLRTLARIHTSRDDLAHLRGTGIADVSQLMAATVRVLIDSREHEWKS